MRKRLLILIAVFILSLFGLQEVKGYDCNTADGSELEPICIYTIEDLDNVRNGLALNYILMNDLDFDEAADYADSNNQTGFTTGSGFEPIGDWPDVFEGNFNGDGFTISNLYINRAGSNYVGLFGFAAYNGSSTIKNVTLENVDISGNTSVGGLVGEIWSGATISNIHITGTVYGAGSPTGGVVGSFKNSTMTDVVNNADVSSTNGSAYSGYGGIAGNTYGATMNNLINNGDVTVASYRSGGIAGIADTTSITYVVNTGNISTTYTGGGATMGGIAGNLDESTINYAYSTGDVSGHGWIGGLTGQNNASASIANSYTLGKVTSTGTNYYGKLSGFGSALFTNAHYFDFVDENYAYDFPTVVGTESNYNDLVTLAWQESVLGAADTEMWDFTQMNSGFLPKLMNSEKTALLPGQIDFGMGDLTFFGVVDTDIEYANQGTEVTFTVTFNEDVLGTPTIELQGAEINGAQDMTGSLDTWTFTHTIDDNTEGSVDVKLVATSTDGDSIIESLEVVDSGLIIDNTPAVITLDDADVNTEDASTFEAVPSALDNYSVIPLEDIDLEYYDASDNPISLETARTHLFEGNIVKASATAIDDAGNTTPMVFSTYTPIDNTVPTFDTIVDQEIQVSDYTNINWENYIENADDNVTEVLTFVEVEDNVLYDTIGDYTVTVKVVDDALNETEQTFNVAVTDTTVPNIIFVASNQMIFEAGSEAPDFLTYFTLSDNGEDIPVTIDMLDLSEVDMGTVGFFEITLSYSDGYNLGTRTIEFEIEDTTAPVIDVVADPITIEVDDLFEVPACTVTDNVDDLTCDILHDVDNAVVGEYFININAVDAGGNAATEIIIQVNVIDTTIPVIDVEALTFTVEVGDYFMTPSCSVDDNYDVTLTCQFTGTVDTDTVGEYTLYINASDESDNDAVEVEVTVTVEDTQVPTIEIDLELIEHEKGDTFTHQTCTVSDNYDMDLTCQFTGAVDNITVGEYIVYVDAVDASGNEAVQMQYTVNVVDTTAPVVAGVDDGKVYKKDTELTIIFNEGTATLNGEEFESGDTVTEKGEYTLIVTDDHDNFTMVKFEIEGGSAWLIVLFSILGLGAIGGGVFAYMKFGVKA